MRNELYGQKAAYRSANPCGLRGSVDDFRPPEILCVALLFRFLLGRSVFSGTNGNDNVALADFLYIIAACAADNIVHMIGRWVVVSMSYGAISA